MTESCCFLDHEERSLVEDTIRDHCRIRRWTLYAVNCRSNHVHVVVAADCHPKLVREQFKAWCTRRLKELAKTRRTRSGASPPFEQIRQNWWAERGSGCYINDEDGLEAVVFYVREADRRARLKRLAGRAWHEDRLSRDRRPLLSKLTRRRRGGFPRLRDEPKMIRQGIGHTRVAIYARLLQPRWRVGLVWRGEPRSRAVGLVCRGSLAGASGWCAGGASLARRVGVEGGASLARRVGVEGEPRWVMGFSLDRIGRLHGF